MTTNPTEKVGLVRQAYTGAPHGVAQIDLSNPELRSPTPKWNYKSKARRRQEAIDTM